MSLSMASTSRSGAMWGMRLGVAPRDQSVLKQPYAETLRQVTFRGSATACLTCEFAHLLQLPP